MTNIFVIASIISITFLLAKFLEMRYIEKESKPLKLLIRDAFLVYFSVIISNFIIEQINPVIKSATATKATPVFTDNPGF
jgi:hypothetical protein